MGAGLRSLPIPLVKVWLWPISSQPASRVPEYLHITQLRQERVILAPQGKRMCGCGRRCSPSTPHGL